MKKAKRILAMALAVMMIAGMAPTQAWNVHAEETAEQSSEISSADPDVAEADETDADTAAAYAAEPRAVTTATYEQVNRVTAGEEYLIVYYYGSSYYALTADGNSVTATQVYPSDGEIELRAEENNVLWTVNNNSIQINGRTLKATSSGWSGYSVSLSNNSYDGYNFAVSNSNQIRTDVADYWEWQSDYRYLTYSNNRWSVSSSSNSNFTFYQKHDGPDIPSVDPGEADDPLYSDEAEGGDYPQYPNQGSVRTTKTATADNFRENGVAQVELGVTGVPMKQGVDIVLHASYIIWNGRAILFTAPSGTGKSTQAEAKNVEIINGDRAVLREKDGGMWSYSLPFAGSSGICVNKSAPLRAVVVLTQAAENSVCELAPAEAIKHLYSQCALNRWNREEVEAVLGVLTKMVRKIRVVKLDCLPDQSAVEILSDYLERMEGGSDPCGQ